MKISEKLKSVLCDPEGNISIAGSQGDKIILREIIEEIEQLECKHNGELKNGICLECGKEL